MALKALNFKMDEGSIEDMKDIARVYRITLTEAFRQAAEEYVERMRKDPFYRLTANIENASKEEAEEILEEINRLSDDELQIAASETVTV